MSSIFGRLKGNSVPATPSLGASPGKKSAAQAPLTPLEQLLAEAGPGPLRRDGSDKFFGMHNANNTCYCNSVLQCLYFSEPFREQVVSFPRRGQPRSETRLDPNIGRLDDNAPNGSERTGPNSHVDGPDPSPTKKPVQSPTSPTSPGGNQQENKESFDYQKKLALSAGPHLRMEQGLSETYDMPESLFTGLKDLFEAIISHQSRIGIITPAKFLEILRRNHEIFRSNTHQDAHEFLNLLLNEVVEQVEAYSKGLEKDTEDQKPAAGLGLSLTALSAQAQKATQPAGSWVHELFEGTLTSETRCLTCENVSQRDEAFLDLSVDLEEHSSVTSCLRKFSQEEMLCERNKFHCDKCSGLQEAEKRMKIKRLPRILALHLKRFKFVEEIGNFRKLFHRVVYPFHLRLLNTTDDAEDPDRLYELYAVVVHLGSTPFHGHYVSIIKTKDRGWLLFDDELVLPVDKDYVRNFFGGDPKNPACAYVLFYQETTIEAVQREQEAEEEMSDMPAAANFDSQGIMTADADAMLSQSFPSGTQTPATVEMDGHALEHAATLPARSPNASPELDRIGYATISQLETSQPRRPSAEEPRSPTKDRARGGALHRFRNTSMSIRTKPKFWSSKDRAEAQREADGADGAIRDDEELERETAGEKVRRSRSGRFGFGKKK